MISMYDLTPYDFMLLCMHVISAMLYTMLGIKIIQLKKYLKWNRHIFPRMMIASFGIAVVFLSELVEKQSYNLFFHLFMWLFAYNQFSELFRLAEKYHKIEELEKKLNMNKIVILLLVCTALHGCGTRSVELEKMKQERTEIVNDYEKKIEKLNATIKTLEQTETSSKTALEENKKTIQKLKQERSELIDKLNEERRDDIVIKDPTGKVIVTDKDGNRYEIEGGKGTEIMKTSLSVISRQLEQRTESLMKEQETVQKLTLVIQAHERTIKEKDEKITALNESVRKKDSEISELKTEKKKNTEREAYPVVMWIGLGIVITVLAQLLWKVYKPKKLI